MNYRTFLAISLPLLRASDGLRLPLIAGVLFWCCLSEQLGLGIEPLAPQIPPPQVLTDARTLVEKVEATPYLPAEARQEARHYFNALSAEYFKLSAARESAFAERQTMLAAWQKETAVLTKRNAEHQAKGYQFKPDETGARKAYDDEAISIERDLKRANDALDQMNVAWKKQFAELSRPVAAWLKRSDVANFPRKLQDLLDGHIAFESGVVDPRLLITPSIYTKAQKDAAMLKVLREQLEEKIVEVQGWKTRLEKDFNEFEALRREAQRELVFAIADALPVGAIFGEASKNGIVTEASAAKIEAGFEALKGLVNEGRGFAATEDAERFKRIMEGNRELTKAMETVSRTALTKEAQTWLKGFDKAYKAGTEIIAGTLKNREKDQPADYEPIGRALISLGEIMVPGAAALSKVERLGEHGVEYWAAAEAQTALGDALSKNWDAERHLNRKLERLKEFQPEVQRLIDGYESLHPKR